MENPIKMDDLGVPLFLETPIYNKHQQTFCLLPTNEAPDFQLIAWGVIHAFRELIFSILDTTRQLGWVTGHAVLWKSVKPLNGGWFLNLGGLFMVIYIYIHIFLYTTGTVCICLYATKMRAPFKESVVQKFPFFWGEWLYITQIKVDIYQAKGSFLVKICEEKTTQMVGISYFFLGNGELNDWIPSWTTGWLLSCWHLSIRSYLHWFPFPYHPWDWYIYIIYHFLPLKTIKCR